MFKRTCNALLTQDARHNVKEGNVGWADFDELSRALPTNSITVCRAHPTFRLPNNQELTLKEYLRYLGILLKSVHSC